MNLPNRKQKANAIVLTAILTGALAGCTTTTEPQPTVRSTTDTAPADLQLLCASAATSQLGLQGNVLPVSSTRAGDVYQVNLTHDGGQAVCFVDDSGNIQSVGGL